MPTDTGTSKYMVVREALQDRLSALSTGDKLPSEKRLCEQFDVSRITLRHAVDGLVNDGFLVREHGRGTFVAPPRQNDRHPERFTDSIPGFHRQQTEAGNTVTSRVLRQELVSADAELATRLGVKDGTAVIELVRLRYVNGQLHQYVVTFLPYEQFPQTLTTDFSEGSLYDHMEEIFGVVPYRNDLTVRVEEAPPEVALNLEVQPEIRLLSIASTVFDQNEQRVAFGIAWHTPATSEVDFSMRLAQITPENAGAGKER